MNIDEKDILKGNRENLAMACLLAADVVFMNVYNEGTKESPIWSTCLYVNCGDVFMWGCADAEAISNNESDPDSEVLQLYKLWKENPNHGPDKWVCMKRQMQPQLPLKKMMIKAGYWDSIFEALPLNYDSIPKPAKTVENAD